MYMLCLHIHFQKIVYKSMKFDGVQTLHLIYRIRYSYL